MLRVWLPLNGDLHNQGCSNASITNTSAVINTAGKIGSCYSFGTAKSYLKFDNMDFIHNFTECSVSLWIKILSWNTSYATYFQFGLGSTPWAHYIFGLLRNSSASTLCFTISNGSSATNAGCLTPALELNTWYHLTLTYTAGHCKIYVNGIQTNDYSTTIVPNFAGITTGTIGVANNLTGYQTNCLINDFRIYDHCLSAAEVREISQGLVLHYKLNDAVGFTDLIARGTTWTIYNNHNNTNMPSTLVDTGNMYNGDKVYRETCTPTDNSINSIRTSLGSHGVYNWRRTFAANTKYVFWIYYKPISHPDTRCGGTASNIGGWTEIPPVEVGSGWYRVGAYRSGTVTTDKTDNIFVSFKVPSATVGNPIIIDWASPHLLEGTTEIPPYDYPSTIIQDSSGYNHNGTSNNIVLVTDSARFNNASQFNGTNSYIKVTDNDIMIQGMEALTINLWAKSSSWPTNGGRLFSCTETGGFNSEGGNSGYWRFPIHVYTNVEQTSTAYKYDSKEIKISDLPVDNWVMITWVYNTTGTRTYINGTLHHTYTNTSYGIHFNKNARLFLGCEANTASPSTPYYNGQMSDFRLYTTALDADAIRQLYEVGAKVDNKNNVHSFELNEDGKNEITKAGQLKSDLISEFGNMSYLKYDNKIYIEPDGSCWARIYHHNNPGAGSFSSSNDFAHSVYIDENRWFNVELCNYLDKWELMVKGKFTSTSNEWKLRWIQNVNPMTAAYADVAVANITKITTDGYSSSPSSWGGLYAKKSSAYLTANNGNSGNWWGAVGSYSVYQKGIPGWGPTTTVTTTGFNDLYVRIDNVNFSSAIVKISKNNIWTAAEFIEL